MGVLAHISRMVETEIQVDLWGSLGNQTRIMSEIQAIVSKTKQRNLRNNNQVDLWSSQRTDMCTPKHTHTHTNTNAKPRKK